MTKLDWILGYMGAAIWISAFIGMIWLFVWLYKNLPRAPREKGSEAERQRILNLVCEELSVTPEQVLGKCKSRKETNARKVYTYLCRKVLGRTVQNIADELNCHHSSVIYSIRAMEDYIFLKEPCALALKRIENKFFNL